MARILVVDDDEPLLDLLEKLLTASGHAVVTARDGLAGAALFRAEPFDLILTDVVMPNREGLETVMELRREYPGVAVIAMSGGLTHSRTYLQMATRLGAHETLAKPFTPAQLASALQTALERAGHK